MSLIIGLTGPLASGKGVIADFLIKKGFIYNSLSQVVRDEADLRNLSKDRKTLQDIGNSLRQQYGTSVLADKIKEKLDQTKNNIIDGIRNPGEVKSLRKLENFILIGITASKETRFKRALLRNKESDPKTLDEFIKLEARDRGDNEPNSGQQVDSCLKLVDIIINNEFNNTDDLFKELNKKLKFLGINL